LPSFLFFPGGGFFFFIIEGLQQQREDTRESKNKRIHTDSKNSTYEYSNTIVSDMSFLLDLTFKPQITVSVLAYILLEISSKFLVFSIFAERDNIPA